MIRQAQPHDLPQLVSLWQEAFLEDEADARFYFENRHQDQNMLLYEENGLVTGMLSMLPLTLVAGNNRMPVRYVFAVATRISHRGQGISTRLLQKAHEFMTAEGCAASVLVPAEPSLFAYYEKREYAPRFYLDQVDVKATDIADIALSGQITPCSTLEYKQQRDAFFADGYLFAQWDETALGYIKHGNEHAGGGMVKLRFGDETAYAVIEQRGDHVRVSEYIGEKAHYQKALALIHQQFKADRYRMLLPATEPFLGNTRHFGMIHWLKTPPNPVNLPGYLAFAKD